MTFSLTVLGSSSAAPAHNRNLSAHLLNAGERFFLIDCGEGTQFQLRRYHLSMQRIKHIFISHLHGDHYFGLIGLLNTMHLHGRTEVLHLYAPPQLEAILAVQLEASCTILKFEVSFHPLRFDTDDLLLEEKHLKVFSFPLKHSVPACGFSFREIEPPRKITTPRSYAWCSDTAYSEEIIPHIRGVSLLYHEATFLSDMQHVATEKMHSTAADAATIAKKAGVGQLMIGHFSARYESPEPLLAEARAIFPNTIAAEEGVRTEP